MTDMLTQTDHARILADIDRVSQTAGVQVAFLRQSMTAHCGADEVDWVRKFWQYREEGCPGLLLEGVDSPDTRCQAIAGALVRNYIDARVIPVNSLIDGEDAVSPTVLVIPNLYMNTLSVGKSMPSWRIQILYDLLLERSIKNKPTVVYVEALHGLELVFGKPFRDFLSRFTHIKG